MMPTSIVIIVFGLFIFLGHYLNGVFERKSIPDVLGLMFIGMLLGPVLHRVE
jgi:potassium/hydrogen antiporter